ncbi:nucleoside triphosphate pyrophosphohydrolase [Clostridium sp. MSJ-8]|uniref:nucleoside triphosphate pyrophosphohydrolase n=1 Tax=Clostridium sp. MSJ-8 TaxID=2841510 RepID=UPI001C0F1F94|nr:nucleoside triphosphate pyrophosphohydrolase [Clostridium sp. MSJ-8]MBU5486718.1 nucleoside triphosphate pyrophosphohydrolase [Clostridium sp. MSJ-8]
MIYIVGLGPGDYRALTIGALEVLENNNNIYLRTDHHPMAEYLQEKNISYKTYDYLYDDIEDFEELYMTIADKVLEEASNKDIVYAVPGHPLIGEKSVTNLIQKCDEVNIEYQIIAASSFVDAITERLQLDMQEGLKVIDVFEIDKQIFDKRIGTIIMEVQNQLIASEVKIKLLEYYEDEADIYFCKSIGIADREVIKSIKLYELDMQEEFDEMTSIYIPKNLQGGKKDIYDLVDIIDILRGENGCPWDMEQTHESIRKAIVEESYEVLDAIEKGDMEGMIEELGDVLLQVVFHAAIEKEEGYYNLYDIIEGICNKMIYRHPHVFTDKKAENVDDVLNNWDELKRKEKHIQSFSQELDSVAKALPALIRANKIQKKAHKIGFDMEDFNEMIEKVKEELNEVIEVYNSENKGRIQEEVGDLFFSCVNLSRYLDIDAEEALNESIEKFINRIKRMEELAAKNNSDFVSLDLQEKNFLWKQVKNKEK